MSLLKIFIVEDDAFFAETLKYHLSLNSDNEIHTFELAKNCLKTLHLNPDVICIDLGLPDMDGATLFHKIQEMNLKIPIIMISGQDDISLAVNLLKEGLYDYMVKSEHTKEQLWNTVQKIRETHDLIYKVTRLQVELGEKYDFSKHIIGQSDALKKTFQLMKKAITTNITVSIVGETGTGKELIAKAIHYNSTRKKKDFVAINMAAIPKELVESELFGFEKGSFTGANERRIGKFEQADGGTIFLDEIAELDLGVQSKLLRVLQERELTRIGGKEKIKFDVRLIVATHKNLANEVKNGNFREDLYYRILGLPIELAPLRERKNDVILLAKYFIEQFTQENNMKPKNLTADAKTKLMQYPYPGNIRELKSVIDLACVLSDTDEITSDDIQFSSVSHEIDFFNSTKTLREFTNEIILYYLKKNNNDVLKTAQQLDIGKSTIYNLLKQ